MSINTDIQWCHSSENPVMGCGGCELRDGDIDACYAGGLHDRKKSWIAEQTAKGKATGHAPTFEQVTRFAGRVAAAARWPDFRGLVCDEKPWLTSSPRLIFLSDMGDALSPHKLIWLRDRYVPVEPETDFDFLYEEIVRNVTSVDGRRHIWLWLTKRPERMVKFNKWLRELDVTWPTNLWPGTSITDAESLRRVGYLLEVGGGTTRFLSVEPQIELISLRGRLDGIAWVIQGGESGARNGAMRVAGQHVARTFAIEWARALRDECREADVPYFLKQLGTNVVEDGKTVRLRDRHGGDWSEWPQDIAIREVPGVDKRCSTPRRRTP